MNSQHDFVDVADDQRPVRRAGYVERSSSSEATISILRIAGPAKRNAARRTSPSPGCVPLAAQKAMQRRFVVHQKIDQAGQESGIVDGVAHLAGRIGTRQRQKTAEHFRIVGKPAEDGDRCLRAGRQPVVFDVLKLLCISLGKLPFFNQIPVACAIGFRELFVRMCNFVMGRTGLHERT